MDRRSYRAYICCGRNCGPKGSAALIDVLEDELTRQSLTSVVAVLPTGCQAHCDSGPTMVVYPGPVYYQEVDAARLRRIVSEHFGEGQPVKSYFWNGEISKPPEKKYAPLPELVKGRTVNPSSTPRKRQTFREPDDFRW